MKLIQASGLKRKKFEVIDDVIKVSYKTLYQSKEWTVKLENLGNQIYTEVNYKKGPILLGLFFLLFAIFFIAINYADKQNTIDNKIWIIISVFYLVFSGMILLTPSKREVHLTGGFETLVFFQNSPSKKAVDAFISQIINKTNEVLLKKYGQIDPDLPEETMINQLNWLKNRNVITYKEYENLKHEYYTKKLLK